MTATVEDFKIESFQDSVDYIVDSIGAEFEKAVLLAQAIAEKPGDYTGPQAAVTALRLAAHRTKIGLAMEYQKRKATETKKPHDRLKNDALHILYDSLLELINCLKVAVRTERDMINGG